MVVYGWVCRHHGVTPLHARSTKQSLTLGIDNNLIWLPHPRNAGVPCRADGQSNENCALCYKDIM